jgi:hypothetical protein
MAEDFPALERPANAISGANGGGRPAGWATEISNSAWRNKDMEAPTQGRHELNWVWKNRR